MISSLIMKPIVILCCRVLNIMNSDAQKDPEVFPDALRARVLVNQVNFTIITVSSHVTEKKILIILT